MRWPLCVVVLRVVLTRAIEKERAQLREQVPDALRCMEACMHAGLSLPQTFSEVAQQIDQPARSLLPACRAIWIWAIQ